jgi:hypothetical protein
MYGTKRPSIKQRKKVSNATFDLTQTHSAVSEHSAVLNKSVNF